MLSSEGGQDYDGFQVVNILSQIIVDLISLYIELMNVFALVHYSMYLCRHDL
jgi:hypothetical protein